MGRVQLGGGGGAEIEMNCSVIKIMLTNKRF